MLCGWGVKEIGPWLIPQWVNSVGGDVGGSQCVRMSVCVSVRSNISKTASCNFPYVLAVGAAWSTSVENAIRYFYLLTYFVFFVETTVVCFV